MVDFEPLGCLLVCLAIGRRSGDLIVPRRHGTHEFSDDEGMGAKAAPQVSDGDLLPAIAFLRRGIKSCLHTLKRRRTTFAATSAANVFRCSAQSVDWNLKGNARAISLVGIDAVEAVGVARSVSKQVRPRDESASTRRHADVCTWKDGLAGPFSRHVRVGQIDELCDIWWNRRVAFGKHIKVRAVTHGIGLEREILGHSHVWRGQTKGSHLGRGDMTYVELGAL